MMSDQNKGNSLIYFPLSQVRGPTYALSHVWGFPPLTLFLLLLESIIGFQPGGWVAGCELKYKLCMRKCVCPTNILRLYHIRL